MSHTPIYDELRESRLAECAVEASDGRPSGVGLVTAHPDASNVDRLTGRGGLGGRHRQPSS